MISVLLRHLWSDEAGVLRWCFGLTALISITFALFKWAKRRQSLKQLNKLDGPKPHFLLGNLGGVIAIYKKKTLLPQPVYIMQQIAGNAFLYEKKGMMLFWFAFEPVVSIFRPDAVEAVFSSSTSLDKSWEYKFLHPWLGLGLLTSTGSKWRARRRILTPAFHFRILEDFIPVFNEQSVVLVKKLRGLADQEWIDITPLIILCTLDIVSESVMGIHIGAQDNSDSDYVQAVHSLGGYFNHRTARPWLWPDILFYLSDDGRKFKKDLKVLHSFTRQVIKERKMSMLQNPTKDLSVEDSDKDIYITGSKRKAFMDLLLDLHIKDHLLSEEDIREEVDTFMFEGHDTTAMGISWALYCIGLYPEIQKKIIEESDSIFLDDQDRPVSHDDVRQMKYLECVLKESQRIFPSVPLVGRVLDEEITIDDVTIPKKTVIHLSIVGLHKNSKIYPNPEVFDPDRFLPENAKFRHPYAFIPFSAGPRNCIGISTAFTNCKRIGPYSMFTNTWYGQKFAMMEEKTVISNILRHFEIFSLDQRDKVHMKIEFVLRPAQPLRMKFTPRRP